MSGDHVSLKASRMKAAFHVPFVLVVSWPGCSLVEKAKGEGQPELLTLKYWRKYISQKEYVARGDLESRSLRT